MEVIVRWGIGVNEKFLLTKMIRFSGGSISVVFILSGFLQKCTINQTYCR
jgi:hypothetical protein